MHLTGNLRLDFQVNSLGVLGEAIAAFGRGIDPDSLTCELAAGTNSLTVMRCQIIILLHSQPDTGEDTLYVHLLLIVVFIIVELCELLGLDSTRLAQVLLPQAAQNNAHGS